MIKSSNSEIFQLLLYQISNLLAYLVAFLVACFFWDFKPPWLSGYCVRLIFARSQIRIRHVAEFFLLIRGLFFSIISLDRAAFWSCSRKCLRRAASPLCKLGVFKENCLKSVSLSSLFFLAL